MGKGIAISMVVMIVLLVLSVGYIGYDKYSDWKQEAELGIYQQGAQFGYEQAIAQLYQGVAQCQPVPLTYKNQTVNLITTECLKQQAPED